MRVMYKNAANLIGLKPFKDAKLLKHEAIERMKRRMKRMKMRHHSMGLGSVDA